MNKEIKKQIVGIDLGTTNSVISVLEGGNPIIINNSEGFRTTPSVVAYTLKKECLVGHIAKRQGILNSENTFSSIKRFIGCKYEEIKEEINLVSYKVKKDKKGNIKIYCPILDKDLSPEEISSLILKKLVNDASRYLNCNIKQAVITVPAYFNDSQRMGTKDAGIIAGLEVLRILNEPTAAALAYGFEKKKNEIILIFDLGGGTFDVSILEVGNSVFEVLATSGNTHLGGDNIDKLLLNFILDTFEKENNLNIKNDKQALQRILEAAEKAKIELSTLKSTEINIPFVCIKDGIPQHIKMDITRSQFENLIESLVNQCKDPVEKALKDSKLSKSEINQIILVGGSTRIPKIRTMLTEMFNKPLNETVNPDEVVAMGAAIQGGILAGEITDLILLDVTPLSLGIETKGGLMTTIIKSNSSIPVKQTECFSTATDYQTDVEIHILQGERPLASDNKSLGVFQLDGIPKALAGVPKINVTFQIDVNGLLSVTAREESTQKEQSITIDGASVLSKEEINDIIKKAKISAKTDIIKKLIIPNLYNVDLFLYNSLISQTKLKFEYKNYFNELIKKIKLLVLKFNFNKNFNNLLTKINLLLNLIILELIRKKYKV
jgi:molecular chaperone DnaK